MILSSRLRPVFLGGLAVALLVGGCSTTPNAGDGKPLVVATTTILGDVVRNVVGDEATVEVLMPVGADPHSFQASARQAASLREAVLVVSNGLGLEEGLVSVLEGAVSDGANVLEVGPLLDPVPIAEGTVVDDHAGADDDDDPGLDPHVWMDPVRVADAAGIIADALDVVAEGDWQTSASAYRDQLLALDADIAAMVAGIPAGNRRLVTSHLALGYFAQRYGFEMIGAIIPGGSTSAEPSAADLAALAAIVEEDAVPAIFGETISPTSLSKALAGEVGFPVAVVELFTGSLGPAGSGADTYLGMMRTDAERIAAALGGV